MGRAGSGYRSHFGARLSTDDYLAIDVRRWAREGMLRPGYSTEWQWWRNGTLVAAMQVRFNGERVFIGRRAHRNSTGWSLTEYPILIERTRCHLGGARPWFRCPVPGCERRVAVLYGRHDFACRHCQQVAYASTREERGDRAIRRANRIRSHLGWPAGVINGRGSKPKWMRWKTFNRLAEKHDRLLDRSIMSIAKTLGIATGRRSE